VGGRAAKHVVLTVRENVGCDPGFFYSWHDVLAGALWTTTDVGTTIRVWIVDIEGTRLFIEAETSTQADSYLEREIEQILGIDPLRLVRSAPPRPSRSPYACVADLQRRGRRSPSYGYHPRSSGA
jgi:hypothetical protein